MTTFNFTEMNQEPTTETVTSWFINTALDLGMEHKYIPRENISFKSDKTEGDPDKLLTRIKEKGRFDLITVTVDAINLHYSLTQKEEVVDTELDALLGNVHPAAPLFSNNGKPNKRAEVFCYINCTVDVPGFLNHPLKGGSILIRQDAPKQVLSRLLAISKQTAVQCPVEVTGLVNPRIKEVITLVGNLDDIV